MKQLVENEVIVNQVTKQISQLNEFNEYIKIIKSDDIILFSLFKGKIQENKDKFLEILNNLLPQLPEEIAIGIMGENEDLAYLSYALETGLKLKYQIWITLRKENFTISNHKLPNETAGVVFFTRKNRLKFERVLLPYTYCPSCNKTTKDYGGKKHTFHEFGTTMSDVWKDIYISKNDPFPEDVISRIQAMFSTTNERTLYVFSMDNFTSWDIIKEFSLSLPPLQIEEGVNTNELVINESSLINGDSLEVLQKIPTSSIDYVFVDPPYNLKKKYASYEDALEIEEYFSWCDKWLEQCYRALKPGKYLTILNIPNWSIRHFAYLTQKMKFESWITWDALSKPSGKIMPANYTLLTFKKPDNGIQNKNSTFDSSEEIHLKAMADYYCLRASCIKKREPIYKEVTDLWTDIHRLKHNSQRYDHPCQLHPLLMQRLIQTYSQKNDFVLDCFNGVGTTTLSAEMLNRNYVGIEIDPKYHEVSIMRHADIKKGLDPFRKNEIESNKKVKNNDLKRISKRKPEHSHISKKEVQLHMKDLAANLGHAPTKEEALIYLPEVPEEFYDLYFSSWSEVIVSVNVGGVKEENYKGNISSRREDTNIQKTGDNQLNFQLLK